MSQVKTHYEGKGKTFYIQKPGIVRPDENETEEKICLVFDLLTDPANVDELRDRVGLSQFDVLRAIYLLLEGEYIRPLEVEELMDAAILARQDKNYLRATDLLERAHLLDKTDPGILEACVEVARRLDDSDRLGALLAALGTLKVEAGDFDEGIDHLELALKNEPSNLVAMTALRDAYFENDDIERAADLSLRMSRTYAENNHLFQAVESARVGLEVAPHAIALRYYLAQLLARTSRNDEAKAELYHLIEETEGSKKAMRSAKAHELLSSCYRLLLRIDPLDARAVEGRSLLGRRKMAVLRRQRLFVRGGIVAGVLAVAAGIAMVMGGPGPHKLLESVQQAAASNDRETMLTTLDELVRRFPESPEASQALEIKRKIEQDHAGLKRAHRDAQNALRETITDIWVNQKSRWLRRKRNRPGSF